MVTLWYHTNWQEAVLHYTTGRDWRDERMQTSDRPHWRRSKPNSCPFEFVVTDGSGHWDNPSPDCHSKRGNNYLISTPGTYALYRNDIITVRPETERVMLITDLDGTLLEEHNPEAAAATERFTRYWLERHYFNESKLIYSTGRSLEQFLSLYETGLPVLDPDMLITAVGSDAYIMSPDTGLFELRTDYHDAFDRNLWDTDIVSDILNTNFKWLIYPSTNARFEFKTWRIARIEDLQEHEDELRRMMANEENIAIRGKTIKCKVIVSGRGSHRYIDFVPTNGGKEAGVDYCRRIFRFEKEQVLVAGDSGNDIAMFEAGTRGVITSNRQVEIEEWFYRSGQPKNVLLSTRLYADAIIEALDTIT